MQTAHIRKVQSAECTSDTVAVPCCQKAAAVALFNHQILSLEAVARLFAANPNGRSA